MKPPSKGVEGYEELPETADKAHFIRVEDSLEELGIGRRLKLRHVLKRPWPAECSASAAPA